MKEYEIFVLLASVLAMGLWHARAVRWSWGRRAFLLTVALSIGALAFYPGCARVYIRNWDYLNGYYHAGRLVLLHASEQFYFRDPPGKAGGFVNLPIVSLLYVPLALLSPTVSMFVNGALGVVTVAFTLYLLLRDMSARPATLVAILFLASGPLWYSVTMGNLSHFLLLPLYGVFILSARRRDELVGVLLALLSVLKPYLMILVVYFTLRRRFRVTSAYLLTMVALFAASVAIFGLALNVQWWQFLSHMGRGPVSAYNNQSLNGFLVRLLQHSDLSSDAPQMATPAFRIAKVLVGGPILGASGWVFLRVRPPQSRAEEWQELAIVLTVGTLFAPISWSYYYTLLLIPLALYLRGEISGPRVGYWPIVVAAALLMPPVQLAYPSGIRKLLYHRLLLSHYFLGGLVLLWVLLGARWLQDRERLTRSVVAGGDRPA
jgi:hypothetical protein